MLLRLITLNKEWEGTVNTSRLFDQTKSGWSLVSVVFELQIAVFCTEFMEHA